MSSDGSRIEFSVPPAQLNRKPWKNVAAKLRARPGEWAHIGRELSTYVTQINQGSLAAFRPAGSFEATCRNVGPDRRADLWVRYVGEEA